MYVSFQNQRGLCCSYCLLLVFPLIFHSIQDEIPEASRLLVNRLFQLWLVLLGTLIINVVTCIIIAVSGFGAGDLGGSIGSACSNYSKQLNLTVSQLSDFHYSSFLPSLVPVSSLPCPMNSRTSSLPVCRPIYNGYMKVKSFFGTTFRNH